MRCDNAIAEHTTHAPTYWDCYCYLSDLGPSIRSAVCHQVGMCVCASSWSEQGWRLTMD